VLLPVNELLQVLVLLRNVPQHQNKGHRVDNV
jgi:hypothetical protein